MRRRIAAAETAGCTDVTAPRAVRAILASFFEQLPEEERRHFEGHLPVDVRVLTISPKRSGATVPVRDMDSFLDAVLQRDHMDKDQAPAVITAVLRELRVLVPEETTNVAAVLPTDLHRIWADQPDPERGPEPCSFDETPRWNCHAGTSGHGSARQYSGEIRRHT